MWASPTRPPVSASAPLTFVLPWRTGHIGAKSGLPYAKPFALRFGTREFAWAAPVAAALLWLARALSVGAILLLARFVRHAEALKVGSLLYREPATAIEAWLLFASRSDGAGSRASRWGGLVMRRKRTWARIEPDAWDCREESTGESAR